MQVFRTAELESFELKCGDFFFTISLSTPRNSLKLHLYFHHVLDPSKDSRSCRHNKRALKRTSGIVHYRKAQGGEYLTLEMFDL